MVVAAVEAAIPPFALDEVKTMEIVRLLPEVTLLTVSFPAECVMATWPLKTEISASSPATGTLGGIQLLALPQSPPLRLFHVTVSKSVRSSSHSSRSRDQTSR